MKHRIGQRQARQDFAEEVRIADADVARIAMRKIRAALHDHSPSQKHRQQNVESYSS
jgi:hypothetical protein